MNKFKLLILTGAAAAGLVLAGCSTPESRIAANPAAFAALTAQQQATVRSGGVTVGMGMDAVKLALGNPDRVTLRTDAQGQSQIWHYVEYAYADGPWLYPYGGYWGGGWRHRGYYGGGWGGWGPGWGWDMPTSVYDRFQVTFQNGVVSSFRQEMQ